MTNKLKEDEEYLDEQFPKGKNKYRGQAMVLLALARQQQKQKDDERFEEFIKKLKEETPEYVSDQEVKFSRIALHRIIDGLAEELKKERKGYEKVNSGLDKLRKFGWGRK